MLRAGNQLLLHNVFLLILKCVYGGNDRHKERRIEHKRENRKELDLEERRKTVFENMVVGEGG